MKYMGISVEIQIFHSLFYGNVLYYIQRRDMFYKYNYSTDGENES